jgi:hypothetical protein
MAPFGSVEWWRLAEGPVATAGNVMLAALPVFIGIQLLTFFLACAIHRTPRNAIHRALVRTIPGRTSGKGEGGFQRQQRLVAGP